MQLRAMAKINLGLDVVRKREDGYHEVRMIMQTIRMFDRVTVYRIPEPEIRISSNLHLLTVNENNIAYKAARMMLESQPVRGGVSISLQKRIPVAAGMAGGSADAAAVLYAMNRIFYMGYTLEELFDERNSTCRGYWRRTYKTAGMSAVLRCHCKAGNFRFHTICL